MENPGRTFPRCAGDVPLRNSVDSSDFFSLIHCFKIVLMNYRGTLGSSSGPFVFASRRGAGWDAALDGTEAQRANTVRNCASPPALIKGACRFRPDPNAASGSRKGRA